jgi:hypothetical protein
MKTPSLVLRAILALSATQLIFTSCSHTYVSARIYPYSRKDLPSYHIDTPDLLKANILPTEVLAIDWKLPSSSDSASYHLNVTMRFFDESEKEVDIPLSSLFGKKIIELSQDEYKGSKGGIKSYRILLMEGSNIIAQTRHKLWEDKIIIQDEID